MAAEAPKKHSCEICWEEFNNDVQCTPCFHKFHNRCIKQWIIQHNENERIPCPICKTDIKQIVYELIDEYNEDHSSIEKKEINYVAVELPIELTEHDNIINQPNQPNQPEEIVNPFDSFISLLESISSENIARAIKKDKSSLDDVLKRINRL